MSNLFLQALKSKQTLYGLWQGIADTTVAEIGAGAGFDWLLVDGEHGLFELDSIFLHLQAIEPYRVPSVVRVAEGNTVLIKKYLDIGVTTILVPMVESAEQANEIVRATKYPPEGIRGLGTSTARAAKWNRDSAYLHRANDEVSVIIQIETVEALNNLEAIASIEGVDALFIGPSDLSASMGFIGQAGHPEVVSTVKTLIQKTKAMGKPVGVFAVDNALAKEYEQAGADFIAVGVDASLLAQATSSLAAKFKGQKDQKIAVY